jgi:hypothetical protein
MKLNALLILLTLFYSLDSRALDFVKTLNQINERKYPQSAQQCLEVKEDLTLNEQCARELCGKPKDIPSASLTDFNFDQYVTPGALDEFKEIEGKLKEISEKEIEQNKLFLAEAEKRLQDNLLTREDEKWSDYDIDNLASELFLDHVEVTVDNSKPKNERVKVKITYPSDASSDYKSTLDAYAKDRRYKIENDKHAALFENYYTSDEAHSLLKREWLEFHKNYQLQTLKDPKFMQDQKEDINRLSSEINNEFDDLLDISSMLYRIENLLDIYTSRTTGNFPLKKHLYNCQSSKCRQGLKKEVLKFDYTLILKKMAKKNAQKDLISKRLAHCKSEFAATALRDSDQKRFKALMPEIKKQFTQNVLGKYSLHSQKKFLSYLNNDIFLNFDKEKAETETFKENVESEYQKWVTGSDDVKIKNNIYYISRLIRNKERVRAFPSDHLCDDQYLASVVWDSFAPKEWIEKSPSEHFKKGIDNISVSIFSCTHLQSGKEIMAHELGHALSYRFYQKKLSSESSQSFQKLRQCSTSLYRSGNPSSENEILHHPGDELYTEEDTADLISHMSFPNSSLIFECALLDPQIDGERYENVTLKNEDKHDPHSSPLIRVLREAIHKKKHLPASCQQIIERHQDEYRFSPCY